jgi:hypothetical protein
MTGLEVVSRRGWIFWMNVGLLKALLSTAAPATFRSCLPGEGEDRARRRPRQAQ